MPKYTYTPPRLPSKKGHILLPKSIPGSCFLVSNLFRASLGLTSDYIVFHKGRIYIFPLNEPELTLCSKIQKFSRRRGFFFPWSIKNYFLLKKAWNNHVVNHTPPTGGDIKWSLLSNEWNWYGNSENKVQVVLLISVSIMWQDGDFSIPGNNKPLSASQCETNEEKKNQYSCKYTHAPFFPLFFSSSPPPLPPRRPGTR